MRALLPIMIKSSGKLSLWLNIRILQLFRNFQLRASLQFLTKFLTLYGIPKKKNIEHFIITIQSQILCHELYITFLLKLRSTTGQRVWHEPFYSPETFTFQRLWIKLFFSCMPVELNPTITTAMFGSCGVKYVLKLTEATPPETSMLPCNKRVKLE